MPSNASNTSPGSAWTRSGSARCFTSPFADAGYDVADYLTVAPRYGTNDDLVALVDAARARGIRVLLDLVAGHTSDQHPWFRAWADDPDRPPVHRQREGRLAGRRLVAHPGPARRVLHAQLLPVPAGAQLRLRAAERARAVAPAGRRRRPARQPAGVARRSWRTGSTAASPVSASTWRPPSSRTIPGWSRPAGSGRDMRAWIDQAYPECALLSEWGDPSVAVPSGFHADFFLHFRGRGPALAVAQRHRHARLQLGRDPGVLLRRRGQRHDRRRSWPSGGRRPRRSAPAAATSRCRPPTTTSPGWSPARATPRQVPAAFVFLTDLAVAADHLLRRRDRHALHRGPARQGGQHARAAEQPHRLAYADAVGRLAQRGLLDRAGRPALPADRPRPGPADGGRPARRRGLAAAPRTAADRPAEGDAGARAGRLARGAARGLPAGLHPRRHPPGGRQPPPGAGGRSAAGGPHVRDAHEVSGVVVETARSRPTASGTGSSRWARARGVPPTRSGSRSARPSRAGRAGRRRWRRRSGGRCRAVPWCGCPAPGARATRAR